MYCVLTNVKTFLKEHATLLKSLFEDNSGGLSTIRIIAMLWILILIIIVLYCTYKQQTIDLSVVSVTTIIISGKVIQRFCEN